MKKMTSTQIRQTWLNFFKSKGHHIEQGASLIPKNDPTLLWINAGVAALKKYFDGSEIPPSRRITNAQKSIRTNDIDHVGYTARHHTFFEMLGNFSIGDYFRDEIIPWAVELLTDEKWFGFSKDKLYITYHPDDLQTKKLWINNGINEDHLIPLEGNFWEIGEGPCGPDTEIFYDRGNKYDPKNIGIKLLKDDIENDRYIEIWNIVFSQYNSESGKKRSEYKELPSKNIDTGAGLERFACIIQNTDTNFETDLFLPLIKQVETMSNHIYENNKMAFRVIADHIRAITFALADGEMFSNEGRGYVLRRLLRRADRYGKVLGINDPFLFKIVDTVNDIMKDYYPYLVEKTDFIKKMIKSEEEKFIKTLENGESLLLKSIENNKLLSAEDMFKLYDTFGFPKELTIEICKEHNVNVDLKGFDELMKQQKERARNARGDVQSMKKQSYDLINFKTDSKFSYDSKEIKTEVIGLFKDGIKVSSISDSGDIILKETNFYAESGGQIADTGFVENENFSAKVVSVIKAPNKQHLHHIEVLYGSISVNDIVNTKINYQKRSLIARNHSSVHLLQKALQEVLGEHIAQHGSYVTDEYSHFDFNHFEKMTPEQINEVEKKVNTWIFEGINQDTKVLPIKEAKKIGAKALFDDKYGDIVRVVCFGEVSKEFCGGTHVQNSSEIGLFVIEYEESVASGIRRIQSRTSKGAYELIKKRESYLTECKKILSVYSNNDVVSRINALIEEKNILRKENESLSSKIANSTSSSLEKSICDTNGLSTLFVYQNSLKRNDIISILDNLKQIKDNYFFVLIGKDNATLPIVCYCSNAAISKGLKAGEVVKKVATILGGSGGGRNEMASGAGKNENKINEVITILKDMANNG